MPRRSAKLARREGLTGFLDDGCIEINSNTVERTIRPIALNRRNALFAGSDGGGQHWRSSPRSSRPAQIQEHFAHREVVMQPRFRTEREGWVQRVVADGRAICILPERSAAAPDLITRPIEGLSLERELVLATVSGSTTPVEIRKIAQLASRYEWQ